MIFEREDYAAYLNEINNLESISFSDDDDYTSVIDETIKDYKNNKQDLYSIYKKHLYSKCNHVLANIEDHTYCIKCGVEGNIKGIDTSITCDKCLAMAITRHIIEDKPTINSKGLSVEFKSVIEDIRTEAKPKIYIKR